MNMYESILLEEFMARESYSAANSRNRSDLSKKKKNFELVVCQIECNRVWLTVTERGRR